MHLVVLKIFELHWSSRSGVKDLNLDDKLSFLGTAFGVEIQKLHHL